jgi:Cu(I)/Ag(I) efflux system membrane fusion protein
MDVPKDGSNMDMSHMADTASLAYLSEVVKPTDRSVISSVATTTIQSTTVSPVINALGSIAYDTRHIGIVSSWVAGRIEKLYVHYRYQEISKGQKIMDIYSPELLTAEENLLFLFKNDPTNTSLIGASKERLRLLGMSTGQLNTMMRSHKPFNAVTIYSNYSGHIHDAGMNTNIDNSSDEMKDVSLTTEPLSIKEGMYVQKGQVLFSIYDAGRAWVLLNIYPEDQAIVEPGNKVHIICESGSGKEINGKVDFIEPFFRKDSRTLTARVYFNNSTLQMSIGSQVKASIDVDKQTITTLPATAVVSLGMNKIVFRKVNNGFTAHKVETGETYQDRVQILSGLSARDSVAVNAQFLMDSESIIKAK